MAVVKKRIRLSPDTLTDVKIDRSYIADGAHIADLSDLVTGQIKSVRVSGAWAVTAHSDGAGSVYASATFFSEGVFINEVTGVPGLYIISFGGDTQRAARFVQLEIETY